MTDPTWALLRRRLAEKYDELRILLMGRLGSDDLARETLHETWLRLGRVDDVAIMRNPDAYLARVALNLATDRQRFETRRARRSDVNAVLEDIIDDVPGQTENLEARRELAIFENAIRELPERRRAILIAARFDEEPVVAVVMAWQQDQLIFRRESFEQVIDELNRCRAELSSSIMILARPRLLRRFSIERIDDAPLPPLRAFEDEKRPSELLAEIWNCHP